MFCPQFTLLRTRHRREGERERVHLVVAAELGPGAVTAGPWHQAVEGDVRTAPQFLQIGARRNQEFRGPAVVGIDTISSGWEWT